MKKIKRTFLVTFDNRKVAEFENDDDIKSLKQGEHVYGAYDFTEDGCTINGQLYKVSTNRKYQKDECWIYPICTIVSTDCVYKTILIQK